MRILTNEDYDWRTDLYDKTGDLIGEEARSKAVDRTCGFTSQMALTLEQAIECPDMVEDLAKVRSTRDTKINYHIDSQY